MMEGLLPGYYLKGSEKSSVAVCSLLNEFSFKAEKVCLAGPLMTENLGVSRVVHNILLKPNIRHLILCGNEVRGHYPADALKHLYEDGIYIKKNKIYIKNTKAADPKLPIEEESIDEAVLRFKEQVSLVDLVGITDIKKINKAIDECLKENKGPYQKGAYILKLKSNGKGEKPLTGGISIYKGVNLEDLIVASKEG